MDEPRQRSPFGVPDALALALVVGALGALWFFFRVDQRPPMDLGHYFEALPGAWQAVVQGDLAAMAGVLPRAGGLYNLSLGALTALFGRHAVLMELIEALWLLGLLLGCWGVARRLGGPWAALASVALCTAMPVFHTSARSHWIHLPEATLLVLALWGLLADPALDRWRTRVALFLTLALAFSLRPTALLFGGPLLLLAWHRARPRARVVLPALSLVVALLLLGPSLPDYIGGKTMIRDVYAELVAPLLPSLVQQAFVLPGLALLAGVVLVVARGPGRLRNPALWLLAGWALLGLALCAFFRVGPDNFTLLFVGGAILAGLGLALPGAGAALLWGRRAVGVGLAMLAAGAMTAPFLLGHIAHPLVPVLGHSVVSLEPQHYLRPQVEVLTLEFFWPLVDEACVNQDDTCTLLASRGLVNFSREDNLALATFFEGRDGVRFHNAGQYFFIHDIESADALEGLFVLDCPHAPPEPDNLFSERERALEAMVEELEVSFLHQLPAPLRCSFRAFRLEEADPHKALADFWLNYPWVHSGPKSRPPVE